MYSNNNNTSLYLNLKISVGHPKCKLIKQFYSSAISAMFPGIFEGFRGSHRTAPEHTITCPVPVTFVELADNPLISIGRHAAYCIDVLA